MTGSSRLLDELQASARRRVARPGRGAPAPGLRALRRRPGPDGRAGRRRGARAGRRRSPPTSWWPACCWCTACTPSPLDVPGGGRAGLGPARSWPRTAATSSCWRSTTSGAPSSSGSSGSCDGCPSSAVTLQGAVEAAIVEAAPEIDRIVVEEPTPAPAARAGRAGGQAASYDGVPDRGGEPDDRPARRAAAHPPAGRAVGPAARRSRSAASCAPSPSPTSTGTWSTCELADLAAAPAGAATCSSRRRVPAATTSGAVPDRYRRRSPTSSCRRPSGTACRSRSASPSSSSTPRSSGSPPSTPARPARPSRELPLDTWDEVVAANPQLGHAAARRRGVPRACRPGPTATGAECYIVPIDACYELVGPPAHAVARLRRRAARPTTSSTTSSPAYGQRAPVTDLDFEVVGARPEPHAAVPTIMFRLRVSRGRRPDACTPLALRCQIRIEPQRRRYEPARGGAPLRAVRRDAAVGRLAAPVPVDPRVDR